MRPFPFQASPSCRAVSLKKMLPSIWTLSTSSPAENPGLWPSLTVAPYRPPYFKPGRARTTRSTRLRRNSLKGQRSVTWVTLGHLAWPFKKVKLDFKEILNRVSRAFVIPETLACRWSFFESYLIIIISDFQANGQAAMGQYGGGVAGAAGGQSLFVADHKY